jgi:hypothetical protein
VEFIPEALDEGVLYVSLTYGTVSHRCCCGCGREVVTPLAPTDWKLIFDGETISLYPSIGNWNFPCRSHYWIWNSFVEWAENWSERKVKAAMEEDRIQKNSYYRGGYAGSPSEPSDGFSSSE